MSVWLSLATFPNMRSLNKVHKVTAYKKKCDLTSASPSACFIFKTTEWIFIKFAVRNISTKSC